MVATTNRATKKVKKRRAKEEDHAKPINDNKEQTT